MPVTLEQIAKEAGVSRGTVDRALHARGQIRPELAEKIKAIAEKLGYQPNMGARTLALTKKNLSMGVILQYCESPFIKEVYKGVQKAAKEVTRQGCKVDIRKIEGICPEEVGLAMDAMINEQVKAIAVVGASNDGLRDKVNACVKQGIPVVTFNAEIDHCNRIAHIGEPPGTCGRAAAGLMGDILTDSRQVAIISGSPYNPTQERRVRGFLEITEKMYARMNVVKVIYTYEDTNPLDHILEQLIAKYPDLEGIYMTSQGQKKLCDAMKKRGLDQKIKLIVNDMAGTASEDVLDGTINYVIDEDPIYQGSKPVRVLFDLLVNEKQPQTDCYYTEVKILSRYTM